MSEALAAADLARVPILTYHSLDESGSVISVHPSVFRRQMEALASRGYQGVALGDLLEAWLGRRPMAARPVVLTFDDAFRNTAEEAAPVLAELRFRATVFAVSDHCGGTNDWPTQPLEIPRLPLLSFTELRDLAWDGFEVGSHGVTHAALDQLAPAEAESEVLDSKRRLEDALGQAVRVFAYPYGRADDRVRDHVRTHYHGACSVELGMADRGQDRHWLSRIDAYYVRDPALFGLLGTRLGSAYLGLRAAGRRLRRHLG
jgi:peptidoglycan/xylan/chitin deacetylase (PgdA/CDA1 family)